MGKQIKTDAELLYKYRGIKVNGVHKDLHRHIMEGILGRHLTFDEVVHHKDGNKLNNDPANLEVMSRADHMRLHGLNTNVSKNWASGVYDSLKKAVVAFNVSTGKLAAVYRSIADAERDKHTYSGILRCLKGRLHTHHGCVWYYVDDPAIQEAIKRGSL